MNRTVRGESVYPDEAPVVDIGWMKSGLSRSRLAIEARVLGIAGLF